MTAYRGSVTLRFGALVDGTETFSASTYTTMELVDASLAGDGIQTPANREVIALIAYMQRLGTDIGRSTTAENR